jgi:hypothetical protein
MLSRSLQVWPVLPLALVVVACTTTGREAMTARLEVAPAQACATAPALTGATAMTQKKKDEPHVATIRFADAAACLTDAAGNRAVYSVIDLPANDPGSILTVTSYAMGQTIFSPKLEFRDAQGAVLRQVGRDAFMFNGTSLQAQLRSREGERFLVIASDGATVGKTVEQIKASVITSGVMVGTAWVPVNSGAEAKSNLVFAHNGEVTTTLAPMPKEKNQ